MKRFLPNLFLAYKAFRISTKENNLWFIKLRFIFISSLILFLISIQILERFDINKTQLIGLIIITVSIFFYNLILKQLTEIISVDKLDGITQLHLSLIQIVLDLISLSLVVYFTGSIESPFFLFYLFHMIIGVFFLQQFLVYILALILWTTFSFLSYMEIIGRIEHYRIQGLLKYELYSDFGFMLSVILVFGALLFVSIFITGKIVSELYKREMQIKSVNDQLSAVEKSKQKFIMGFVHELKSPIAAASTIIDLILGEYLGEVNSKIKAKLNIANSGLLAGIEHVNEILSISKFKLLGNINKSLINPSIIFEKNLKEYSIKIQKKNIKLKVKNELNSDYKIEADPILIKLIFSNLLSNAVKYTQDNGMIEIELFENKNKFNFIISDDGIGIPLSEQNNIFHEFYRASNAMNNDYEGTGTGLSIVKEIIDIHNGAIYLKSPSRMKNNINAGTSFFVEI